MSISCVCRQLGYSKQAYYKSKSNQQKKTCYYSVAKQKVLAVRKQLPCLGVRKLYYLLAKDFKSQQIPVGRDKLFRILRHENLLVVKKKRYTKTTQSHHWMQKYPNLIKGLQTINPEQLWVADITWLNLKKGPCYLHLITDGYSKKIMGYEVSNNLLAASTIKALKMALKARTYTTALIHHSNRGFQYCSTGYVNVLKNKNIAISMTQDGSPYDNAVAERVNGILKQEFDLDEPFEDIKQAKREVKRAVGLYNNQRPHLSNTMLTPMQMHEQNKLKPKAWHKKIARTIKGPCDCLPSLPNS